MSTVDCETSEEYFYESEQSSASEASEHSFYSANEEFFLPYDERTDVRFQLIILSTNCLKVLFLAIFELFGGSSKHKRICLYNDCSSGASCSKKWITLFQRIRRSGG